MRLKIVRSREASPVLQNSSSQTKIMGNVSMKKIKLIHGSKRCLGSEFKPITTQISLCDSKPTLLKRPQNMKSKPKKTIEPSKTHKNQPTYYRGAKHIELSFEE